MRENRRVIRDSGEEMIIKMNQRYESKSGNEG